MVVLDTDFVSLLERRATSPEGRRLAERLDPISALEQATTVVSYEEQLHGWLAVLAKARIMVQQVGAYRRLRQQLENYCRIRVLEFDEVAATIFQSLSRTCRRVGTMDFKIAAITLAHDATLLTRNTADFRLISGLRFEDWTV
jgi:tRNA(fMet)-specific endonuclease VapC